MKLKKITVVYLPDGINAIRQYKIPRLVLYILILLMIVFLFWISITVIKSYRIQTISDSDFTDQLTKLTEQINKLDDIQNSINEISYFISSKQIEINDLQKALLDLQNQKTLLEPLVKADQKTADSIIEYYTKNLRRETLLNQIVGFFLSFLAGLLVAFTLNPRNKLSGKEKIEVEKRIKDNITDKKNGSRSHIINRDKM